MEKLNVLIACEYSGIVRTAFENLGHRVISCDLLPSERTGRHYQGNVLDILYKENYDLMIGHPPCTFLSYAANKYFNEEIYGAKAREREILKQEGIEFFLKLWNAPIKHICLENPKGYICRVIKQTQVIHPYFFGENEVKQIFLWLKNLPPLVHTKQPTLFEPQSHIPLPEPKYISKNGDKIYRTQAISGTNKDRSKERSRFFVSIADAMALQWTQYICGDTPSISQAL